MAAHSPRAIDARHMPLSRAQKLAQDAAAAAELRAWQVHPDVVALRTEKIRGQVDGLIWVAIVLGLGFTMVNVQSFAAAGASTWSLAWWAAWLLDPMVSLVLIAVLRAEQVTAREQVDAGPWAHRTKWATFAATYLMNTWLAWSRFDVAGIVLHSVPPVLVATAAATAPKLRDALTEAVLRAGRTWAMPAAAEPVGQTTDRAETTDEVKEPATPVPTARPAATGRPARSVTETTGAPATERPTGRPAGATGQDDRPAGPDVSDLMPAALDIAAELGPELSRDRLVDALRSRGLSVGGNRRAAVYAAVKAAGRPAAIKAAA